MADRGELDDVEILMKKNKRPAGRPTAPSSREGETNDNEEKKSL